MVMMESCKETDSYQSLLSEFNPTKFNMVIQLREWQPQYLLKCELDGSTSFCSNTKRVPYIYFHDKEIRANGRLKNGLESRWEIQPLELWMISLIDLLSQVSLCLSSVTSSLSLSLCWSSDSLTCKIKMVLECGWMWFPIICAFHTEAYKYQSQTRSWTC